MTPPLKRALLLGVAVPVTCLSACVQGYSATAPPPSSGCSTDVVPALAVAVRDSATQKGIASGVQVNGVVSGRQGTYVLSQPIASDTLTVWIGTISGTYNIALHRAGYQDVTKNGIVVAPADSLDCHPRTVSVDVSMQPTS